MSERISSRRGGHWLVFDNERRVIGCHCGFQADTDSDCGWGDSAVDHIYEAGRVDASAPLPAVEALADGWAACTSQDWGGDVQRAMAAALRAALRPDPSPVRAGEVEGT